jgi:hypothetical protein
MKLHPSAFTHPRAALVAWLADGELVALVVRPLTTAFSSNQV